MRQGSNARTKTNVFPFVKSSRTLELSIEILMEKNNLCLPLRSDLNVDIKRFIEIFWFSGKIRFLLLVKKIASSNESSSIYLKVHFRTCWRRGSLSFSRSICLSFELRKCFSTLCKYRNRGILMQVSKWKIFQTYPLLQRIGKLTQNQTHSFWGIIVWRSSSINIVH